MDTTYDPAGGNPTLHSETRRFKQSFRAGKDGTAELKTRKIDEEYIAELSDMLIRHTADSRFKKFITPDVQRSSPIERAQILLGRVYEVSWILLP